MLGEDIGIYGGAFGVTKGMLEKFGPERIRDTPISELGIVGAAVGAAMCGMRPVVEIQFSDFTNQAMDQIVNQAAKIHFMLGGAAQRADGAARARRVGHRRGGAALAVPRGLVRPRPRPEGGHAGDRGRRQGPAAVRDRRPEPGHRARAQAALPHQRPGSGAATSESRSARPPSAAEGDDLTIVATGVMVGKSLEAAEALAAEGVGVTVVDPRTLVPFDEETVLDAVRATGRVLLVQEAPLTGGFAGEIAARIAGSDAIYSLLAPIKRLCGLDAPIPYAPELERASVPQVGDITTAARDLVRTS